MTRKIKVHGNAISEADITHLSLVKRGANKVKFALIKAANALAREVAIVKADDERHLVYGVVYQPNVPDTQLDWMSPAEIQKAAHRFLASGAVKNVDHEHNLKNTGSVVVESFIARDGDADFPPGAWVVGCHIPDAGLWSLVKRGEISGFSMYGQGVKTPATIEVEKSALVNRNLENGMTTMLNKASVQPPATPHEESADTAEKEARRAHVANRRAWESEQFALQREALFIADKQAPLSPRERARLLEIETRIAVLDSLMWDGPWDDALVKQESALDLLERGIATSFYRRGGTSQTIDVNLPSGISKGADAELAADLASEALGVRRPKASIRKGDVEIPLSNPFGLRYTTQGK